MPAALFRILMLLALLGCVVCFVMYAFTGQPRYKLWGLRALKWTVWVGLAFFGIVILERFI